MENKKLIFRIKALISLILVLIVFFSLFLFRKTSAIPGIDVQTDTLKKSYIQDEYRRKALEGDIVDRNGVILSSTSVEGESGRLTTPQAYSWLIGYNDPIYGTFGLKGSYEAQLYTYSKNNKGANITLTIDDELQQYCYNLIKGTNSSIVVMKKDNAELLALASAREAEFNVNNINQESVDYWNSIDSFWLANGYRDVQEPGSVFKVVSASAIIEAGMESELINDQAKCMIENHEVVNYDVDFASYNRDIALADAIGYSSNVYFATMGYRLGGDTLADKAKDFLIGEDIKLDFTTLTSSFDLENNKTQLVCDSAYGQGKTLITPLHIAMIYQSIANGGEMMKPYMVKSIDLNHKNLYKGKSEVLATPLTKESAATLDGYLQYAASDFYYANVDGLRSKTGTAEIAGNKVKCTYASYNDDYVVVVCQVSDEGSGIYLQDIALDIYDYLK